MGEGEEVSSTPAAVADDDGHGRLVVDVDEDGLDGVGAALEDEAHQRDGVVVLEGDLLLDGHVHALGLEVEVDEHLGLVAGEVALQAAPEADLAAVLGRGAVVDQEEVGVAAVEAEEVAGGGRPLVRVVGNLDLAAKRQD